jgi:outer membrane lipoprotein-sorting protein
VNLATYTDSLCQSSTYTTVVQGTVGVCAKDGDGAQTTWTSSDPSPTPAPTVFLDGYFTNKVYRSDRGVVFCGGPLIEADTFKLNACNARTYNSYNSWNSLMVVATSTTFYTRRYSDTKCQNLLRIEASTYTSGACVNGGDKVSLISSINAKLSTDLTAPRVTQV